MKKQKIVLASRNEGKIKEIKDSLSDLPIEWLSSLDLDIPDIEETEKTYQGNALLKARHAAQHSGLPTIADDSGLSVDALDGAPGIYSARYAGNNATDKDRINKLLTALEHTPDEKRSAAFHCAIAMVRSAGDLTPILCEGKWEGRILHEPHGTAGFGYDPIFFVPTEGCSAAQLDKTLKNTISHRARALNQFRKLYAEGI